MAEPKELRDGEMLLANMEPDKARKKFSAAIKKDPKNPRAHFGLAESLLGIPDAEPEKIASAYEAAIELEPEEPMYLTSLGSFCVEVGKFDRAESLYERAAAADIDNAANYWADFAIGYSRVAPVVMERYLDEAGTRIIRRKSLIYLLRALDLEPEAALKLLNPE